MAGKHPGVNEAIRTALGADDGAQVALAARLGVSASTVYRWVSGETSPRPAQWSAIENALGLHLGALATAAGAVPVAELQEAVTQLAAEVARLSDLVQAHERRLALLDADSARKPSARRARADG